jgi:hypothetical protein
MVMASCRREESLVAIGGRAKFGSTWGERYSNEVFEPYKVWVWKNIRKRWGDFSRFAILEVGDGSKIRFRQDVW